MALLMFFMTLSPVAVYAADNEEEGSAGEGIIAKVIVGLGNGIALLLSVVLGRMATIDDFVFNKYPDTKIEFFESTAPGKAGVDRTNNESASVLIWGPDGNGTGGLRNTINQWYNLFRTMAIIVYLLMLIYMGIRIMLSSTGEKMAQYKTQFLYWVVGVAILMLYPYAMKYAIELNNTFVEIIHDAIPVVTGQPIPKSATLKNGGNVDLNSLDTESNPFADDGTDFMSKIANDAEGKGNVALALTYVIMCWQLLTIAMHYYKRILMIGFLIVIFPIVMAFYVLDKVGDGKSQSFDKWNKDFILNVFIQSFHAIVYMFVIGTVYSSQDASGSYDYILVIMGVTFLFTGEEIVKKIFSQDSPGGTVSSLASTAGKMMAAAAVAKGATTLASKPFSTGAQTISNVKRSVADKKNVDKKLNVADKLGLFSAASEPNTGLELDSAKSEMQKIKDTPSEVMSDSEKAAKRAEITKVANAVSALNNPQSRSAQELADAYDTLQKAKGTSVGDAIMKNSNINAAQLDGMKQLQRDVSKMAAEGVSSMEIDRTLKLTLGYMLPEMSEEDQNKYRHMMLSDMALRGSCTYQDPKGSVHDEIEEMMAEINRRGDKFKDKYKDKKYDPTEARAGYYDDEIAPDELLHAMGIEDDNERTKTIRAMEERIAAARVKVNTIERQASSDMAANMLAEESAEVGYNVMTHGEIDTTTQWFEGKTREDILEERRQAKQNIVRSLTGRMPKDIDKGYSKAYMENQEALDRHYRGDGE